MADTLVATGTSSSSLADLGQYENRFKEGDYGRLDIELISPVVASALAWLDSKLDAAGVPEKKVVVVGRTVQIRFKKAVAPLALIVGALAAVILIWGLIVGWKLWKLSAAAVAWLVFGIPVLIITIVIVAIIVIVKIGGRVKAGPVAISR